MVLILFSSMSSHRRLWLLWILPTTDIMGGSFVFHCRLHNGINGLLSQLTNVVNLVPRIKPVGKLLDVFFWFQSLFGVIGRHTNGDNSMKWDKMRANEIKYLEGGWCISSWWPWSWSVYSIYYYICTVHYSYILSNWNKLYMINNYIPRVGVAMTLCWMTSYCYSFLTGFKCIFQLHSSAFSIS